MERTILTFAQLSQMIVATHRVTNDMQCIEDLYLALKPFTGKIVNGMLRNYRYNVPQDFKREMEQESFIVLLSAVANYDYQKNTNFVKYYSVLLQRHLYKLLKKEAESSLSSVFIDDYDTFEGSTCLSEPCEMSLYGFEFPSDEYKKVFLLRFLIDRPENQTEIAQLLGVTQSKISKIEKELKKQLEHGDCIRP